MEEFFASLQSQFSLLQRLVGDYWVVPAGLFVLYFYGTYRFNTPDYDVLPIEAEGLAASCKGQLLSLAPPRFTTTRKRFRRYSLRYTFILQGAFLFAVFFWSALVDAAPFLQLTLPEAQGVQNRAIWVLFVLTGLLSSFPGLKSVDTWLLQRLHTSAHIPDSARAFAMELLKAPFHPDADVMAEVRSSLIMRDTIRVAEQRATGSLERALLRSLCLKVCVERACDLQDNLDFTIRIRRDLDDIRRLSPILIADLRRFFKIQETVVPATVGNIDEFVDTSPDEKVRELAAQRVALQGTCDALFMRLCLLAALFSNATTTTPEDAGQALRRIGFQVDVVAVPLWNWEALLRVALSVFIVVLGCNTLFFIAAHALGLGPPKDGTHHEPGRSAPFLFSIVTTMLYGIVLAIAISLKRHWSRNSVGSRNIPQNFAIGAAGYLAVVPIVFVVASGLPGHPLDRLWIGFAQLSFAVAGYFAGLYLDRDLQGEEASLRIAIAQAGCQFVAAAIGAYFLSPDPPDFTPTAIQRTVFCLFVACQNGLAGLVLGYIVQHFYRSRAGGGGAPALATRVIGDLAVQPRLPGLVPAG